MKFPGLENVFWLSEPFATRPFRGSLREDSSGLDRVEIARGQLVPPQPLRIVPYGGRVPGDFIWTDAGCIILVHERIIDLFSERQFSGLVRLMRLKCTTKRFSLYKDFVASR